MNKTIEALFDGVTEIKELYKPLLIYGEREGRIEKVCQEIDITLEQQSIIAT